MENREEIAFKHIISNLAFKFSKVLNMKIGYFLSKFPYKNPFTGEIIGTVQKDGGVENVSLNLAVEMSKRGHEIFIFTSAIDSHSSIESYDHIKIYRYARSFTIGSAPISLSSLYKPLFLDLPLDIVHVHLGNLPLPLIGYFYSKIKNKPLITTYHGDYMGGFGSLVRRFGVYLFDNFIADMLLNGSSIVLTPSEHYINESKHLHKINNNVIPISNGINLKYFDLNISKAEARKKLNLSSSIQVILLLEVLHQGKLQIFC
jgi:glycosyltransferase involved in cell wall biosynthesis